MDDNQFDDIIKGKVENYRPHDFDPAALAGLHHRLDAIPSTMPWYKQYRSELFTATGVVVVAILLLWGQWSISNQHYESLQGDIRALQLKNESIAGLQREINNLKNIVPDTVRIIESSNTFDQELYAQQYAALFDQFNKLRTVLQQQEQRREKGDLYLGTTDELPKDLVKSLILEGFATQQDNDVYLTRNRQFQLLDHRTPPISYTPQNQIVFVDRLITPKNDSIEAINKLNSTKLSASTLRDLEKHYRSGIDIKIGPTVEIFKGQYPGQSVGNIGFGLLADVIFSPSLSLETGAKYFHKNYETSDQDDISELILPLTEDGLGPLKTVDIDHWMVEIPLNLKYRYPLNMQSHLLMHSGYSTNLLVKEKLEYEYELDISGQNNLTVSTNEEINKSKISPGSINFGVGISKKLQNKNTLETSLYYQHGIGALGVEQVTPNFFGIRGVYWLGKK